MMMIKLTKKNNGVLFIASVLSIGAFIFLFGGICHAATISVFASSNSVVWVPGSTACDWASARNGTCSSVQKITNFSPGGITGIKKFTYGGNGLGIYRSAFAFDLSTFLGINDNIAYVSVDIYGGKESSNSGQNVNIALYVSDVGAPGGSFSDLDFENYCGDTHSKLASVNDVQLSNWNGTDKNTFILNTYALQRISEERFAGIVFCLKDKTYDVADSPPTGAIEDFIYTSSTTPALLRMTTTGGQQQKQDLYSSGLTIDNVWACCSGRCGNQITAPVELGWFGIGATSSREVLYGLDNDCVMNPLPYFLDFSNQTQASSTMATTTQNGWHDLCLVYILNNVYQFRASGRIQIISAPGCYSTSSPDTDFAYFCLNPCNGLATSSSFFDTDNFVCGARKIGCWALNPSTTSLSYLTNTYATFKTKFPFNLYFSIMDSLKAGLTQTDDKSGYFSLPMYSRASGSYYMIKVLDASSTANAIGQTNANTFRTTLIFIIYGAVAVFIIFRLTKKE